MLIETRWQDVFRQLASPDHSGLPKYQRLAQALIEAIRRGVWAPGARLPSEDELTAITTYSLGTVQRALRELSDQGLVVRQHGLGSFVAARQRELHDPWHCRFLDDDLDAVLPVFSQAISRSSVAEWGPWTRWLGVDADVMRLDRMINVNNEFDIYIRFYADRTLLGRLWELPLEDLHGANFKKLIARECALPITEITHLVSMMPFDAEVAKRVHMKNGERGMFVQGIAQAGRNLCVYYQEFFLGQTTRPLKVMESHLAMV